MHRPSLRAYLKARAAEERRAYDNFVREQERSTRAYLGSLRRGYDPKTGRWPKEA